jgi:primosomal protein N' (replication factor Y)
MSPIARVVVDLSLDRWFDYEIPPALAGRAAPGCRVTVPFGRRRAEGFVVELADRSEVPNLKPLLAVDDNPPLITEDLLKLARWIADYYCAPLETAVRAVLPAAVRREGARFREERVAELGAEPPAADAARLRARAPRQWAAIEALRAGPVPVPELLRRAPTTAGALRALAARGWVRLASRATARDPLAARTILPTQPLPLMEQQAAALAAVSAALDGAGPRAVLLFGETGSGKTEVYLQAIARARAAGRGAIVLVPEIALTPQTVERFVGRFGARVAVLHSHLSDGERHDEWHRIRRGEADIVVGARSAVFAPVANLGLIVVDEEHEPAYKQDEAPRYHARDVAVMRAHLAGCAVVLGSATPSLESWANARRGKYALARMPARVDHRRMPRMHVVDLRASLGPAGRPGLLAPELADAVRGRLERGEQVLLFLNRRGFATALVCHACGFVARCDQCSVACTYHRGEDRLRCHLCGGTRRVPERCPSCADPRFKYSGAGTQRVEDVASRLFPHARLARLDSDTTGRKDVYERVLGDFRARRVDILIGTQMIAKGLHFPNVTLVGVVNADVALHLPDFRASERTVQLLAQVAGRAGRGEVEGDVYVQTYTPFHAALQAARRLDYEGFCDQELEFRRELKYPPHAHLVCVTLRGRSEEKVRLATVSLHRRLRTALPAAAVVSEPGPAPLARVRGEYRYQLLLRHTSMKTMNAAIRPAVAALKLPAAITCVVDVDAVSVL